MLDDIRRRFNVRYNAHKQAVSNKRLDLCAAQFAHVLHLAGKPELSGKTCLEIGAGRVLSHALVCHLLGAGKVVAMDLNRLADPSAMAKSIRTAVTSIVRDILSPFEHHDRIRSRLDNLLSIDRFDFATLERLGIEYRSPVDIASTPLHEPVDFIYSWSVLQHVPQAQVKPLLDNLAVALRTGGSMLHNMHLEDIAHFSSDPFNFYALDADAYTPEMQNSRGNRLRGSAWQHEFGQLQGCTTKVLYAWQRTDVALPSSISSSIRYTDEQDLRTSHLGIWVTRN